MAGSRILELLKTTPLDPVDEALVAEFSGYTAGSDAAAAAVPAAAPAPARQPVLVAAGGGDGDGLEVQPAVPVPQWPAGFESSFGGGGGSNGANGSSGNGANGANGSSTNGAAPRGGAEAARRALGEEVAGSPALLALAEVVMGKQSEWDLMPSGLAAHKAQRARQQLVDARERARLAAVKTFRDDPTATAPFPPAPELPAAGVAARERAEKAGVKQYNGLEVELEPFEQPGADVFEVRA